MKSEVYLRAIGTPYALTDVGHKASASWRMPDNLYPYNYYPQIVPTAQTKVGSELPLPNLGKG